MIQAKHLGASVRMAAALAGAFVALGAPGTARAEKSPSGKDLLAKYDACWGEFNAKQWEGFTKCYAPDAVSMSPTLGDVKGAANIVDKHAKPLAAAMPDAAGDPQLTVVSGTYVARIALMRGTHTGPLVGPGGAIPATGKRIGQLVAHVVQSGKGAVASKEWFIQDTPTMMAELGLSKAPARPALDKGWTEKPVAVSTGDAAERANLAVVRRSYALFNAHDKKFFDTLDEGVVDGNPALPADLNGKAAVTAFATGIWQMSSNVKVVAPVMFAAGDYVVAVGDIVGTNDGDNPAMGIKKTGKKFKTPYVEFLKVEGGKLKAFWPFIDNLHFAAQLGLAGSPSEPHATR